MWLRYRFSACTVKQWKIKMQTIQYRRTRIWGMKKGKYTKTLAKNQFCEIFQMRDIGKNGLPKLIKLCMNAMLVSLLQEHQYGVSIQSLINLGKPFFPMSRVRNISQTWFLARVFVYLSFFIPQILVLLYWMVCIFIFHCVTVQAENWELCFCCFLTVSWQETENNTDTTL